MKSKMLICLSLAAGLLAISGSAWAHHSNALVDKDRLVTMTGTVTKFAFLNPHVSVYLDVKDPSGKTTNWITAGGSPLELHRDAGWTNKTFKEGDKILVQGHPNRDGQPLMQTMRLYRCDSGEEVPLNQAKENPGEYLSRVPIVTLPPARVEAVCSGKEQIADQYGPLANKK